jgi:hypothetical protein
MTITPEQLDELEAVARAATGERWRWIDGRLVEPDVPFGVLSASVPIQGQPWGPAEIDVMHEDAAHIAAFDPATVLALIARVRELEAEVMRLRATNRELNRRATVAEAACRVTVEDCRREGVSLGRSLANAGYATLEAEIERLRGLVYDGGSDV